MVGREKGGGGAGAQTDKEEAEKQNEQFIEKVNEPQGSTQINRNGFKLEKKLARNK